MHKPLATLLLVIFLVVVAVLLVGYSRNEIQRRSDVTAAVRATGGVPQQGKDKIRYYGCGSCHTIPGIQEAKGKVGPAAHSIRNQVVHCRRAAQQPG